nr:unnamed protein product [Digitaria exilis]
MEGGHALRAAGEVFLRATGAQLSFSAAIAAAVEWCLRAWGKVRAELVVPLIRAAVVLCMVMSVIVLAEKVFLGTVSSVMKLLRRRPWRMYRCDPIIPRPDEEAAGSEAYPMVLVQIPMYNEKEELVKSECERWAAEGINIKYETRKDRAGYKAGNLKEGMRHAYVRDCEFVAMFDADFQPAPDFLARTVPFLVHNPSLALVQARWKFGEFLVLAADNKAVLVLQPGNPASLGCICSQPITSCPVVNANDCLLTRMQEMSMDYHFKVEQEAGSSVCNFFGYNGTAGVWRTKAIIESGGWEDRTTAEDMDLALRAGLLGWEFVYVGSIKVKSELPSTLKAYRSQQHRWSCGPALLFKKMFWEILAAKKVSVWKKLYMIYDFFIARRIVGAFFTLFFFSILIPLIIVFPEAQIPMWELIYIPTAIILLHSVGTPRSIHLIILWFLFENVMALHRFKAILIGFSEADRANEWIVTQKLGNLQKPKSIVSVTRNSRFKHRFYCLEIFIGMFLLFIGLSVPED